MPQTIQRSFTGGEIAPSLRARADTVKYSTGLALCQNFIVRSQGGVYSRQGTRYIGSVGQPTKRARLIPFSFSTTQTYILVFEDLKMRVIKDGGYVLSGPSPYEISTPYTEAQLSRLSFTQDADVMTIVHPSHDPRTLSRTAHDNWTLAVIDFAPSIAAPAWATTVTKTITNITQANPAVVTTSAAHTLSTDDLISITGVVGMTEVNNLTFEIVVLSSTTFLLKNIDSTGYTAYVSGGTVTRDGLLAVGTGAGADNKTYTYVVTAVSASGVESVASSSKSLTTKSLTTTAGIRLSWQAVSGASYYRVYKDPSNNTGIYGWIGDSNTLFFDDFNLAPVTSDSPPRANTPFSGSNNKPSCVGYYQQRQIFANTINKPQTVFASQVGVYNSLRSSIPAKDDDAIEFTIKARQVNEIRHIISLDAMVLLTSGGEWKVTEGQDEVLTPSTLGVKIQSYNGSSWVQPSIIGDTVIYVQEKGSRIRDIKYEFTDNKYSGNDLSIFAEHLFDGYTLEESSFAQEPYSINWFIRDDGVLLGLTYQREHQVWAWHQHVTDGEFESVATISEDGRDATYVVVKRTVNSSTVRYIERFEKRIVSAPEDVFCVDSGLTYSGAPATLISGLTHLILKPVAVVADGNEVKNLTVSATGTITLPRAASKVVVGLPYTPVIETLDIDTASSSESLKGKQLSVSRVIIECEKSRGGWVGAKKDDGTTNTMLEIKPRFDSDNYNSISLKTFKQEIYVDALWSKSGGLRIEQRAPFPLAILSIIPEVNIS